MQEIKTANISKLIQVDWPKWKYQAKADLFKFQNTIWIIGLDLNCELCAYRNDICYESAAYIEVSKDEEFVEFGAEEGLLLRAHAVFNQSIFKITRPGLDYHVIPRIRHEQVGTSGMLVEGFRSVMFPAGTAVKLDRNEPLYIHIQTKGYLTAGLHCNLFYLSS